MKRPLCACGRNSRVSLFFGRKSPLDYLQVIIRLLDRNDNSPEFAEDSYTTEVIE